MNRQRNVLRGRWTGWPRARINDKMRRVSSAPQQISSEAAALYITINTCVSSPSVCRTVPPAFLLDPSSLLLGRPVSEHRTVLVLAPHPAGVGSRSTHRLPSARGAGARRGPGRRSRARRSACPAWPAHPPPLPPRCCRRASTPSTRFSLHACTRHSVRGWQEPGQEPGINRRRGGQAGARSFWRSFWRLVLAPERASTHPGSSIPASPSPRWSWCDPPPSC